jgi:hypothetical protein
LDQLVLRFSLLARAPDLTQDQRNLLQQNLVVSSNVKHWLMQVRQDAKQLVHMNDAQLSSPKALSLIDDMARQASYAYIGQTDPSVLSQRGALWMYNYLPYLATFEGLQLARVPDHL